MLFDVYIGSMLFVLFIVRIIPIEVNNENLIMT